MAPGWYDMGALFAWFYGGSGGTSFVGMVVDPETVSDYCYTLETNSFYTWSS
jgi:hypothetical protein